jgi:hypothetical protein
VNDILIGKNDTSAVELDPHFGNRHGMIETMATHTVRTMRRQLGWQVLRGVLGGIFDGQR